MNARRMTIPSSFSELIPERLLAEQAHKIKGHPLWKDSSRRPLRMTKKLVSEAPNATRRELRRFRARNMQSTALRRSILLQNSMIPLKRDIIQSIMYNKLTMAERRIDLPFRQEQVTDFNAECSGLSARVSRRMRLTAGVAL
jgi:hypothetical protein